MLRIDRFIDSELSFDEARTTIYPFPAFPIDDRSLDMIRLKQDRKEYEIISPTPKDLSRSTTLDPDAGQDFYKASNVTQHLYPGTAHREQP